MISLLGGREEQVVLLALVRIFAVAVAVNFPWEMPR